MARQTPAPSGMRAWPQTEVGPSRGVIAPVMIQLRRYGLWLTVAMIFFMVALPTYAEIRPGGLPNISPTRWLRLALIGLTLILLFIKPFRASLTEFASVESRKIWNLVAFFFAWYFFLIVFVDFSVGDFLNSIKNSILPSWFAFVFSAMYIRRAQDFQRLFGVVGFGALLVIVVIVVEFILKRNVFDGIISSEGWNQFALIDQSRDGMYRVKGTFEHPLACAHFLITVGLAVIARSLFGRDQDRKLWLLVGCVVLGGVVLTFTRSGMVVGAGLFGLVIVVKFMVWTSKIRNRLVATVLRVQLMWLPVILIGVAFWVFTFLGGRTAEESMSTDVRLSMVTKGVPAIFGSPIFGYGSGEGGKIVGFKGLFGSYVLDNTYLSYALDYGLIYCLVFLAIQAGAIWRLCPTFEELRCPQVHTGVRAGMSVALMASAMMWSAHSLLGLNEFIFALIGASLCLPGRQWTRSRFIRRGL